MVLGTVLLVVAGLVLTVASIMTVVLAFRRSLGWGLLVLFVPFASVVFLYRFWPETRRAVQVTLAGFGGLVLGIVVLMAGAVLGGVRHGASQRAGGAAHLTPEAPWPPAVATPEPTPTPLPELPIGAPEPTPTPTPVRPLPLSLADEYLGCMVELVERSGRTSRVILHEVSATHLRVSEPYGGGGIAYSVPRERIAGFRPLRPRSAAR